MHGVRVATVCIVVPGNFLQGVTGMDARQLLRVLGASALDVLCTSQV
jgi:hypoxanthine-guanine phosphoribosyltransferase